VRSHPLWPSPGRSPKRGGMIDQGCVAALHARTLEAAGLRLPVLWPGMGCLLLLQAQ
jgi:hypothetical protein